MKKISIRVSLAGALVSTVILTSVSVGASSYLTMSRSLRESLREKLGAVAGTASVSIDPVLHASVRTPEDMETPAYASLRAVLLRIKALNPGIRFLYSFRKVDESTLSFVMDSGTPGVDLSPTGELYTSLTPECMAAFLPPYGVQVDREFHTDDYGTWLSAYAPILGADGSLDGVLGVDMGAKEIIASERSLLAVIVLIMGASTLLMILLGYLFSRRISRPLLALSADMQRIQDFVLDGDPAVDTALSEVHIMKTSLDNMKQGLRSFKKYVPADLVAELISLKKEAVLETEKRDLTVFFSDIEGFTTLAEALGPERLSRFLSVYFTEATSILVKHGATVDKFIGDAVMAFWNAPRPCADHAIRACRAALEIQESLSRRSAEWAAEGLPATRTRIGLNTGACLVGNVGDQNRMAYTAMGDSVNLASRLESLGKYYGTYILMGEETLRQAGSSVASRPVDLVAVKGKASATLISELMPGSAPWTADYLVGWEAYRSGDWARAAKAFDAVLAAKPEDGPSLLLKNRCRDFLEGGTPADWTGVWVMHSK